MDQTLTISAEVRTFIEGLLKDAGMTTLDNEMKEEMIKELFARLDNHITSTIIANLPAEKLEQFIKLNEDKKPKEDVEQFLKDSMPNHAEVLSKGFMEFRDLYLGNVTAARNVPQT